MADTTVQQLAKVVGTPAEKLVDQLKEAGVKVVDTESILSEEDKMKLLAYLRENHGKKAKTEISAPKRAPLKRKTVSVLPQGRNKGRGPGVSVEVRRKKQLGQSAAELRSGLSAEEIAEAKRAVEEHRKLVDEQEVDKKKGEERLAKHDAKAEQERQETSEKIRVVEEAEQAEIVAEEVVTQEAEAVVAQEAEAVVVNAEKEKEAAAEVEKAEAEKVVAAEAKKLEAEKVVAEEAKKVAAAKAKVVAEPDTPAEKTQEELDAQKRRNVAINLAKAKAKSKTKTTTTTATAKTTAAQDAARKGNKKKVNQERKQLHVAGAKKPRRKKKSNQRHVRVETDDKHGFELPTKAIIHNVDIPESIIVADLAQRMNVKAAEVIKALMGLGTMATINQPLDQDTAIIVVEEMGHTAVLKSDSDMEAEMLSEVIAKDGEEVHRGPVVTIMGHVDHGKTSLLDYIRKSRVAAGESGGITQHIGAYRVRQGDEIVTFIDTPGHAAFTAMRARGAKVTDIVVLVVAADDGVMPQTKEAVEHARAAGVPLIIAVNKIDKENAQPDKVKNELAVLDVTPEDWGGDTQFIHVSALTGEGVDKLVESIALQAELLELTAPVDVPAVAAVIESRLDKGRGAVATLLVKKGTLRMGDYIVAGESHGRVKAMFDEDGKSLKTATPSVPVEVLGLSSTTEAGVEVYAAPSERKAREIAEFRQNKSKQTRQAKQRAEKMAQAFSQMEDGDVSTLHVLLKTDVHGSLEALNESLLKLSTDEVRVSVVSGGVGGINESDVNLAFASDALIIGFNVRADASARRMIENRGVSVRYYSIIYDVIDDVRDALSGMLTPDIKEQIVGIANVREVFRSPKFGDVAGCMVTEGVVRKDLPIRVLRDNVVVYEGQLESLRRFKDDVQEVKNGMECGIAVKNYNDVQDGDQIEVFERIEVKRTL